MCAIVFKPLRKCSRLKLKVLFGTVETLFFVAEVSADDSAARFTTLQELSAYEKLKC